jgi:hypothetical protein
MSVEEGLQIQIEGQKELVGKALCPTEDGLLCVACQKGNIEEKCALDLAIAALEL